MLFWNQDILDVIICFLIDEVMKSALNVLVALMTRCADTKSFLAPYIKIKRYQLTNNQLDNVENWYMVIRYVLLNPRYFGREQFFKTKEVMKIYLNVLVALMTCCDATTVVLTSQIKITNENFWTTNLIPFLMDHRVIRYFLWKKHVRSSFLKME